MFINDLSNDDKIVLTQELILSGVNKNNLSKIKPLEDILREEIPYNTNPSTPLDIGTLDGVHGVLPKIYKLLMDYYNEYNIEVIKHHLGHISTIKIIMDNKETFIHTDLINTLDKLMLMKNTGSWEYRKFVHSCSSLFLDSIQEIAKQKVDLIIEIQEKCFDILEDKELLLEYFQKTDKYSKVTLEDINTDTLVPSLLFFRIIQEKHPELVHYLYENNWGDSLVDFNSTLDKDELVNKTSILKFCKERILELSKFSIPQVLNDCILTYSKVLHEFYSTNNLLPPSTFTSRFHNKTSFGNRIVNVFNKVINTRIKRYLISRINDNEILLSTMLLENQIQIYNDYGFNKISGTGVRRIANENSPTITILNKPEPLSKHYKTYKSDLLPYFNYRKLATQQALKDKQACFGEYNTGSTLVSSASAFKTRNDLFRWIGLIKIMVDQKSKEKSDFFENLRLKFKIVLHNLLESTKREANAIKHILSNSGEKTGTIVGEDLITTIDQILIIPEVLIDIRLDNPKDQSLITFYSLFNGFIQDCNKEFPLVELVQDIQDVLFMEESNTPASINYVPNKNKKTVYLYQYSKYNTYMILMQLSEYHRLFSTLVNEKMPSKDLSIFCDEVTENLKDIQTAYYSSNYGSQFRNKYDSTWDFKEFFKKVLTSHKEVGTLLRFSIYLKDFQQGVLQRYFDKLEIELLESSKTQEKISISIYQLLSTKLIDKVNIINSINLVLASKLFKYNAEIETLLKTQGSITNYIQDLKTQSNENVDRLIEVLVNPLETLNIQVPTLNQYQESIQETITRIIHYSSSTKLSLLFMINNASTTPEFIEAQKIGSLRKSTNKLLKDTWLEIQSVSPLINNILAVLSECSYNSKLNIGRTIKHYIVEGENRLPRETFIDFQTHINHLSIPQRERYYLGKSNLVFFKDDKESIPEVFNPQPIQIDYEVLTDVNGEEIAHEKFCPTFRDYFISCNFKFLISGIANTLGSKVQDEFITELLIAKTYSCSILALHEFSFNTILEVEPKNKYSKSYSSAKFKNGVQQFKRNVSIFIQEAYDEFGSYDNPYYKNLGVTMNDLIDPNSLFYAYSDLKSSWKDLPLIWNLEDYFLSQIEPSSLVHLLSWSIDKPTILGLFFSPIDYEKLLSKKFKFKRLLYQELITLFYDSHLSNNFLELDYSKKLSINHSPNFGKGNCRFLHLANNVVTEEDIMKVLHDEEIGVIPNIDNESHNYIGYGFSIKYYQAFLIRYLRIKKVSTSMDDETLQNELLSIMITLIKNGNSGIPAGFTLNCLRNDSTEYKEMFIRLFMEPQLTHLIPVELLTDIEEEEEYGV